MDTTELAVLNDMKKMNNFNTMTHLDEVQQTSTDNAKAFNDIENEEKLNLVDSITMERVLYE